ncbi:MAG: glycosyl hydrolase family 18 protein, partial [Fidelibacterota bacterium]
MFKHWLPYLLILLNLLVAQGGKSIHQLELEYYKTNFKEPTYKSFTGPAIAKQPRTTGPTRTIFGYHPYWQGTLWKDYNYNLLTTIAYFSAEADGTGALTNLHGWPVTDLIDKAHANGVNVVLTVTLFSSSQLEALLSSNQNRQRLITNLLSEVKKANADGVNVDFELFPASQKANLVTFIKDLTTVFHDSIANSTITLATPAVDWNNAWDYNALATASDGLFIMGYDYHWSGSSFTGAVAPLTGGTYNVTNSVNDYLTKTGSKADKIILGCPYYGYEWAANSGDPGAAVVSGTGEAVIFSTAEAKALSYGKLWDATTNTPWYRFQSGGWNQGWYDDSLSLSKKYDLALNKNLQGVGMWALGYDQSYTELWDALAAKFGTPTAPSTPQQLSIRNMGQGVVSVDFTGAESATNFSITRLFLSSTDTVNLGTFSNRPILLQDLAENEPYYLKIKASNSLGESNYTEALGTVPGVESRVLVVNGFDRISGTNNTFDFIRQHGDAIHNAGYGFDAASNEAVIAGRIRLIDYEIVDWILGEEGTATSTFTTAEQNLVQAYLQGGGKLFVSGSEIGYDLSDKG